MTHKFLTPIVSIAIVMVFFMLVGVLIPTLIDRHASTEYYVNIKSIVVDDTIKYGEWMQTVTLNRNTRKDVKGTPIQKMVLYKDGVPNDIVTTSPPPFDVIYEVVDSGVVTFTQDWSKKKDTNGEPLVNTLNTLEVGSCYQWVWEIEFKISEWRTQNNKDLKSYPTNQFCIIK